MAMNLDTTFKLKAKVEGARTVTQFRKQLRGLATSSKMSKSQLGKMNIEINRMARAAGNTTRGLKQHISALQTLKSRTEIGTKSYRRLGNEIDRLKGKLKKLDGQAASTGSKLAGVLATVGVGRVFRSVVGGASRFQEETTKAAAIEGTGQKKTITEAVNKTAQIAAGTPQEVAELATELARMGRSANEITGSLNGIVLGAEATSTSFADMGRIVGTTMQVFGIDVEKTERAVDILTAGANNSAQNVLILGEALKMAAPTAATLGVTLNDTVATLGLLAGAGIRGSEAGTGLRTGLQRLVIAGTGAEGKLLGITRGSKMLTTAMKELGAEVLNANGELKPLDEVIKTLRDNMAGRSQGEQMEIAKALFGTEQGTKFLALIQNADDEIDSMFTTIRNSAEVTQRTRQAMASFGLTTKILGGNFDIVKNQIGAAMITVLHPLSKLLNDILAAASRLPTPIKGLASAFAAAGLAATGLAVAIGTVQALGAVPLLKPIIASLGAMTAGFLGASKAALIFLATNPFGWAVLAVAGITAVLVAFPKLRKGLVDLLRNIINFRNKAIKFIFDIGKNFLKMINQFIINTLTELSKIPIIGKIFGELANNKQLGKIVVTISDKAGEFLEDAKDIVNKGVDNAKIVTTNVVTTVSKSASNILGGKNVDASGLKGEPEKTNKILQGMKQGWDEYKKKIEDTAAMTKAAMGNALQALEDMFTNFFNTGKLAWKDFTRTILLEIQKIVIKKAIIAPIMGGLETSFPKIFKSANGNAFGANGIVPFARGGIVDKPTYFKFAKGTGLMGEAGPEAIMPLKRGKDGKLGVTASGQNEKSESLISRMINGVVNGVIKNEDVVRKIKKPDVLNEVIEEGNVLNKVLKKGDVLNEVIEEGNTFNKINKYADGGIVDSPTYFKFAKGVGLMGEAGPESIMPLKRGSDGKLGVISHGGKGVNVVVNVDASGSSVQGDDQNAAELGRILSSAIELKLIEAQQPGGLLYS